MVAGGRMHHQPLRRRGAQRTAQAGQTEEEEDREGSHDLKQATAAETGTATHSQADGLVRAANPSPDSGMPLKTKWMPATYV